MVVRPLAAFVLGLSLLACTPTASAPPPDDCAERYERILRWNTDIPTVFRDEDASAKLLTRRARSMREAARRLLAECLASSSLTPEQAARVEVFVARLDLILSKVVEAETRQDLQARFAKDALAEAVEARKKAYLTNVVERCDAALNVLEPGDAVRLDGIKVVGQASAEANDDSRARDAYELFLGEHELVEDRKAEEAAEVTGWLATVYRRLGLLEEGVALLNDALKKYEDTPSAPQLTEGLWTLHLARGDIDGMARTSQRVLEEIPRRVEELELSPKQRLRYEGYVVFHGYRRAQAELARGNPARAESLLREHIAAVDRAEKTTGAAPAWKVFRDELARGLLRFVRESAGRPAPPLDLGTSWLDGELWSLAEARGKVVGLVFRLVDEPRSALFLEHLSALCAPRDDFELVVVSPLLGGKDEARMRQELAKLGFHGRAAAVRDREVFNTFHARVGSATLQLIDRDGKLQWFQLDPRAIDVRFTAAIIDRLANQ